MRGFVANTDYDWFTFLRAVVPPVAEVNFWKPGSDTSFKVLQPGEPIFFKLKAPHNAIGGFGYFAHFSKLPVSMAWQVYGEGNGMASYGDMRARLLRIRQRFDINTDPRQDFWIGCILVNEPVFFDDGDWVRMPDDFAGSIVQGKGYDLAHGERRGSGWSVWLAPATGRTRWRAGRWRPRSVA